MYKSYTVNKNDADQRLDKFLTKTVKALPQSMLYKALRTKKIKVNRKRAEPSQRLQEGEVIELYLKDKSVGKTILQFPALAIISFAVSIIPGSTKEPSPIGMPFAAKNV